MGADGPKDTLFGYEIPMPRSDVFIAIATVAAFLPTVVVGHHIALFVARLVRRATRRHGLKP